MIACLGSFLDNLHLALSIVRRFGDDAKKHLFRHVVGTGAGNEHAAGIQYSESAQVDLFVTACRRLEAGAILSKSRGIQYDAIKALSASFQFMQGVEDICFVKLELIAPFNSALRRAALRASLEISIPVTLSQTPERFSAKAPLKVKQSSARP